MSNIATLVNTDAVYSTWFNEINSNFSLLNIDKLEITGEKTTINANDYVIIVDNATWEIKKILASTLWIWN